jgi:hypothetical protein
MQAYALLILGLIFGTFGPIFLFFRARKSSQEDVMLGTAMTLVGWTMAIVGGIAVLLS